MDVHKDTMAVAIAEDGRGGEVRFHSTISNSLLALEKLIAGLRKSHGKEVVLRFAYEAGPCGFVIARRLKALGLECLVAAPSLIPARPGERVKTDPRDALKLARLLRAGELTAVYVPESTDEALRDLCRARQDAVGDRSRNRQRLQAFLLRNGYRYLGKSAWTAAHQRYLRELVLAQPAQKIILEDYLCAITDAVERVKRAEEQMAQLLPGWRLQPAVQALMAFKGFQLIAAMTVVSELGDLYRFAHPRPLMAYLGLVSSEHSSGDHRSQGSITKAGNAHLRWMLIECAQHYATSPKVSKQLSRRQEGLSRDVVAISWKAQNRLHLRFRRLAARRLHRNKIIVAIARELCGFLWAALRTLDCYQAPEETVSNAA
jgi:transposase